MSSALPILGAGIGELERRTSQLLGELPRVAQVAVSFRYTQMERLEQRNASLLGALARIERLSSAELAAEDRPDSHLWRGGHAAILGIVEGTRADIGAHAEDEIDPVEEKAVAAAIRRELLAQAEKSDAEGGIDMGAIARAAIMASRKSGSIHAAEMVAGREGSR